MPSANGKPDPRRSSIVGFSKTCLNKLDGKFFLKAIMHAKCPKGKGPTKKQPPPPPSMVWPEIYRFTGTVQYPGRYTHKTMLGDFKKTKVMCVLCCLACMC